MSNLLLNQTPFYAESGGQVGDTGVSQRTVERPVLPILARNQLVSLFTYQRVDRRYHLQWSAAVLDCNSYAPHAIRANHSATHLLHEALRGALGDHVAQRGSLNAEDRLRFDFSHSKAMSADELAQVEKDVNTYVRQNTPVETRIMTPDDARDLGAQALFGEKYGDEVRVVSMGRQDGSGKGTDGNTYSLELCGGTHVRRTGDIGSFVVLSESSTSSGIRRIEALTGQAAQDYLRRQDTLLTEAALVLKAPSSEVPNRIKTLQDERKQMQNEIAELRKQVAMGGSGAGSDAETINGVPFLGQILADVPGKDLRGLIDEHKNRMGSGAIVLISGAGGKAAIADGFGLKPVLNAVWSKQLPRHGGKGGGGRPDMAQAGGPSADNADAALDAVRKILES